MRVLRSLLIASLLSTGAAAVSSLDGCVLDRDGIADPAAQHDAGVSPCGNGALDPGESCDGALLGGKTCKDFGFRGGPIGCSPSCTYDTSKCDRCGNGMLDPGESCDGALFADATTCKTLGYATGKLVCSKSCEIDKAGCYGPPDWFDPAYAYRRLVTVDHTKVGGNLDDFAVLVHFVGDLSKAAKNGDDLAFVSTSGTRLAYELEYFSYPNDLLVWVRVPKLSNAADTTFYLYYGNPMPPAALDPTMVWDSGYAGVWHLNEIAVQDGTVTKHVDATGHGRDGQQNKNHSVPAKISIGQAFRGQNFGDLIEIAHPDAFQLGDSNATISAWVQTAVGWSDVGFVLKLNPAAHEKGDKLFGDPGGQLGFDVGFVDKIVGTTNVDDGVWRYVVWTQQKDVQNGEEQLTLYVDGKMDQQKLIATVVDVPSHQLELGSRLAGSIVPGALNGILDEVRISQVTRSPEWVATTFANQGTPDTFATCGAEEPLKP